MFLLHLSRPARSPMSPSWKSKSIHLNPFYRQSRTYLLHPAYRWSQTYPLNPTPDPSTR
ncbi:MAG: hypothetical protein GY946_19635 [bacterium]|nr:hypothetical protein [bacterium]